MSDQIHFTGGTFRVEIGEQIISDGHMQEKEALERATNHLLGLGGGDATVRYNQTRVSVDGAASAPDDGTDVEPDPDDGTGDDGTGTNPEPEPDPVEPATVDSPFVQFSEGEEEARDGATWTHYNKGADLPWERPGGDWTDKSGVRHGPAPFASHVYEGGDTGVVEVDVTDLVQGWIAGDYINQGIMLRTTDGGTLRMAAKDNDDPALHPVLVIDGVEIEPDADTTLTDASVKSFGHSQNLSLGSSQPVLLRFPLPETVTTATLRINVVRSFSAGGMQIDVYRCTPPAVTEGTVDAGIASVGLDGHPSVIYRNRLDDPETWQEGLGGRWRGNEVIEDGRLKLTLLATGGGGLNVHYNFANNGVDEPLECYARYHLEISSQWYPTQGGKLPGFAGIGGGYGFGGGRPDGTNGWSNRGRYWLRPPPSNPLHHYVRIGNYTYHPEMEGHFGDARTWRRHAAGFLEFDREYAIETYVRLNTVGEHDGIVRGWVNGVLAYERTGLMFRTVDDLKIETLWLNIYHGGTGNPAQDSICYLRDVVIAREYIGPDAVDGGTGSGDDSTDEGGDTTDGTTDEGTADNGGTTPPPAEPLPDDATAQDILASLEPGQGSMLPPFSVVGPAEGLAMHGNFSTRGPGRRDFCNKWMWAPDRSSALYCGGNHGSPHKFNDVWEYVLASNTWRMLQAPEEGVETLHTWWQLTYDSVRRRLLWMATGGIQTWTLRDDIEPPLVQWTPTNGWEAVATSPDIRTTNGATLEYVPSLDRVIAHNQNWNGSGTHALDPEMNQWIELVGLDGTYFGGGVSPSTEAVVNHDPVNNVLVGFHENSVYVFDLVANQWSNVRDDLPISVHDAGTASAFGNGVHWLHDEDRLFTYDYATDTLTEYTVPALGGSMGYYDHDHGVFVLYNDQPQVYVVRGN